MKTCVAVLSQKLLGDEYFKRLDYGIQVFKRKKLDFIALLSESANKGIIEYVKKKNIPTQKILIEAKSKDTIGEAYFIKKNIIKLYNIKELHLVSSDYHLHHRAKIIFDFIVGETTKIYYHPVATDLLNVKEVIYDQQESLENFFNTFSGVERGDDFAIEKALYEKHKLYK